MIDNEEKLKYINNYLNNYFDKWLFNDIDLMERHELKFTLPELTDKPTKKQIVAKGYYEIIEAHY